METKEVIELLLQQVEINSDLEVNENVERYVKMTMLLQDLTTHLNELSKKFLSEYYRKTAQTKKNS